MSFIPSVLVKSLAPAYGVAQRFGNRCAAALGVLTLGFGVSVAHAETFRLVALGDSLTHGYGLPVEDGFVPQLEAWLQDQGFAVEVVNAGVSGDTTAGGLVRMDWTLQDRADAMLVTLGGNDLLRGLNPADSRANLEGILARLAQEDIPAMLAGLPAPRNYGPEFERAFERMYTDLAAQFEVPLYPDFLQPITERSVAGESFLELMQGDNIHPNAKGVGLIVAQIGPFVADVLRQHGLDAP